MECLHRCTSFLWRKFSTVPEYCAVVLGCLVTGGSLVKELWPLPDCYLSNKRNLLNVYFVKYSWGWTFSFLFAFIALTNYSINKSILACLRRLSALLVGSAIWFTCTNIFIRIENATGGCYTSSEMLTIKEDYEDKKACLTDGGYWHGFDISGHSFLLTYCILIILEEVPVIHHICFEGHQQKKVIYTLLGFLSLLAAIWVFMLITTALYFHDIEHKLLGFAFGILAWYITYRWWYLKPISPGLVRTMNKQAKRK